MSEQKARPSGESDDLRVLSFDRTVARLAYIQSHARAARESGEPCECRVCGGGLQGIYQKDATNPLVQGNGVAKSGGGNGTRTDPLPSADGKAKDSKGNIPWWQKD